MFDEEMCKKSLQWFTDVYILGNSYGVSQFTQFYDRKKSLPCPYVVKYEVEKGNLFLKEKLIVGL